MPKSFALFCSSVSGDPPERWSILQHLPFFYHGQPQPSYSKDLNLIAVPVALICLQKTSWQAALVTDREIWYSKPIRKTLSGHWVHTLPFIKNIRLIILAHISGTSSRSGEHISRFYCVGLHFMFVSIFPSYILNIWWCIINEASAPYVFCFIYKSYISALK